MWFWKPFKYVLEIANIALILSVLIADLSCILKFWCNGKTLHYKKGTFVNGILLRRCTDEDKRSSRQKCSQKCCSGNFINISRKTSMLGYFFIEVADLWPRPSLKELFRSCFLKQSFCRTNVSSSIGKMQFHVVLFDSSKAAFRTLSNIYDGAFCKNS